MAKAGATEDTGQDAGGRAGARRALTDAEILAQIPAARARAAEEQRHGLRAAQARYSVARRQLTIGLTNGTGIAIPTDRVPALVREALGGAAVMSMLGTAGGAATSERKAEAARANGAKGGRPRAVTKAKTAR